MRLREQGKAGIGGIHGDDGGSPSVGAGKEVQPVTVPDWAVLEKSFAIARANQLLAAVTGNEPEEKLREAILNLVLVARAAPHQPHCPVRMLDGISTAALNGLVANMPRAALMFVFEEERKCRAAARPGIGT
jgi:hypothetical protein